MTLALAATAIVLYAVLVQPFTFLMSALVDLASRRLLLES